MIKPFSLSPMFILATCILSFHSVSNSFCTAAADENASKIQTDDEDREESERDGKKPEGRNREVDAEQIERRLDEIEKLIDRAELQDDDRRIGELRREGERLLDQLEILERARLDDDGDFEKEWEEELAELERNTRRLELHQVELEFERLQIELGVIRQEVAMRSAEVSTQRYASASLALTQAMDQIEEPEARADFLEELLKQTEDVVISRMIRHRLAPLYGILDRREESQRIYRSLILGE